MRKDNGLFIVFRLVKWSIKMVLVVTGILPLARCGSGYRENGGKVTFNGEEIADKNFRVLNEVFGKNDSTAFYKRYSIPAADIATFVGLDRHYAKDDHAVYYCDEEREGQNYYLTKHSVIFRVKGAHPASFGIMGEGYEGFAKDSVQAYFKGVAFRVKDVASLSIIDGRFVKDRYQVYFEQAPVKGADPGSFRVLNNWYACDGAHVYYFGYHSDLYNGIHPIPCDPASFVILDYPYSKDAHAVFYLYHLIKGADPATFSVVGNNFSKDRDHVYAKEKILDGADAATFMVLPLDSSLDEANYSKDRYQVYWKEGKVAVEDPAAFRVLGLDYGTDGRHVYHEKKRVTGADPASFKIYDHGYGDADAEDSKSRYLKGEKVAVEEPSGLSL